MPEESFIDKLGRVWGQTKTVLTLLKDADNLARELAPPDGTESTPEEDPDKDNEREDSEP